MRPVDLLPDLKTRRREQLTSSMPRLLLLAIVIWVLVLGGVYAWGYLQKQAVLNLLADVQQQVQALEPVAQRVQQVTTLSGRVQHLRQLLQTNTSPSMVPILDLLASRMPEQVVTDSLSIDQNVVQLSCTSNTLEPVGQFYHNLQQTTSIEDVKLSMISSYSQSGAGRASWSGYSFSVTFQYKGDK